MDENTIVRRGKTAGHALDATGDQSRDDEDDNGQKERNCDIFGLLDVIDVFGNRFLDQVAREAVVHG